MTRARPGLRIALVADEDPGWGGIGTYTAELARGLTAEGHRVELVLRGWEQDAVEILDGVAVHRVTVPSPAWRRGTVAALGRVHVARESLVFSARVARRLGRLRRVGRLDIVEAPEFHAAGLVAGLGSRARAGRLPVVVARLHTPGFMTARLAGERPSADSRLVEWLERAAVRSAALVTSPSAAMAAAVAARWGPPRRPVQVVPNPIDADRFAPARNTPPDRATLLIVGRIERHKGQDVAVEALAVIRRTVPDARLLLVGADSELAVGGSALAALRRRAAGLGLPDDALAASGPVERTELPALYARASVCLVPSRFEAFGYTCLEAMACGRPVVASATGGLAEIVTAGRDGLLTAPADVAALAAAAVALLVDPQRRRALGDAARATVERRFAAPVIARRMGALYADAGAAARMNG